MIFRSRQIKGKGRGKLLGFPTINLQIPKNFNLSDGIYAVWVWINNKKYKGAMHFGPIPFFNETEKSLEVFLIEAPKDFKIFADEEIKIGVRDYLREIRNFGSKRELINQIKKDVYNIKYLLVKSCKKDCIKSIKGDFVYS